jgi:hypothetical protein
MKNVHQQAINDEWENMITATVEFAKATISRKSFKE